MKGGSGGGGPVAGYGVCGGVWLTLLCMETRFGGVLGRALGGGDDNSLGAPNSDICTVHRTDLLSINSAWYGSGVH